MKVTLKNLLMAGTAALVIASSMSCGGGGDSAPQLPGKTMGGAGNDFGRSVQQTTDNGFIIAGSTDSFGAGGSDVYLIKTDSSGSPLWEKTFGGIGDDFGYSVQQTFDNGFIIAGSTRSVGAGGSDVYLIKTDPSGSLLWEQTFGRIGDEYGYSVQETLDGYVVVGTGPGSDGEPDVFLIKTDPSGNVLWEKTFGGTVTNWTAEGHAVQQTSDGGYIITGRAESLSIVADIPFVGLFGFDVYLVKTDSAGNKVWETTLGGAGNQSGNSVRQTSDGGYIITGYDDLGGLLVDVFLIKTDSSGNSVWDETFGSGGSNAGNCVQQTSDNGYILAGVNSADNGNVYLIKTGPSGNSVWEKTFGLDGIDSGSAVEQTAEGGYVIVGTTTSAGTGGSDIYFIKTDPDGNAQ